jgi:hypothetical protein
MIRTGVGPFMLESVCYLARSLCSNIGPDETLGVLNRADCFMLHEWAEMEVTMMYQSDFSSGGKGACRSLAAREVAIWQPQRPSSFSSIPRLALPLCTNFDIDSGY